MRIQTLRRPHSENFPVRVLIENRAGDVSDTGKITRLAYDVLLPLPVNNSQGGPDACDAMGRSLLQALRPYRRDDASKLPPPQRCFTLLRCTSQGAFSRPMPTLAVPQYHCSLLFSLETTYEAFLQAH